MRFIWLCMGAVLAFAGAVQAQVATPSLAPFEGATRNPAAMQWHEASFVSSLAGEGDVEGFNVAGIRFGEGSTSSRTVSLRVRGENFSLGADAALDKLDLASDSPGLFLQDAENTSTNIALALQAGGVLALGIGQEQVESEGRLLGSPPLTIVALDAVSDNETSLVIGGVSWRLGEVFFLGAAAGRETVTIRQTGSFIATPFVDDFEAKRDVTRYGAGIRWIANGGAVRLEVSGENRDPFRNPNPPNRQEDESERQAVELEVKLGRVLFAFNVARGEKFEDGVKSEEFRSTLAAVAWVPEEGLSLVVAGISGEVSPEGGLFTGDFKSETLVVGAAWLF